MVLSSVCPLSFNKIMWIWPKAEDMQAFCYLSEYQRSFLGCSPPNISKIESITISPGYLEVKNWCQRHILFSFGTKYLKYGNLAHIHALEIQCFHFWQLLSPFHCQFHHLTNGDRTSRLRVFVRIKCDHTWKFTAFWFVNSIKSLWGFLLLFALSCVLPVSLCLRVSERCQQQIQMENWQVIKILRCLFNRANFKVWQPM